MNILRLHAAIAAAAPIDGVGDIDETAHTARIDFQATATPAQRTAAEGVLASFDWSPAADDAYQVTAQRQAATALLSSPEGSLKLLRAAFDMARDEINVLRSITPRPLVSITRVNTVATATAYVAHGLITGQQVFVTGCDVVAYNGAKTITVTGPTTFTYVVAGSPGTPASGSKSFVLGTVMSLEPRTFAQFVTAIQARIADGSVD